MRKEDKGEKSIRISASGERRAKSNDMPRLKDSTS
jgi:hypothetical protein